MRPPRGTKVAEGGRGAPPSARDVRQSVRRALRPPVASPPRPNARRHRCAIAAMVALAAGCEGATTTSETGQAPSEATTSEGRGDTAVGGATSEGDTAAQPLPKTGRDRVILIAGGDVCMGRLVGQEILKNPAFHPFESTGRLLATADVRFVNLESQLSEQKGETQSPTQKLVFTGPPGGADALARGKIDVVSLANNHMWDYGKSAFLETLLNLERAGVKYAGAGRTRERAYAPEVVDAGGFRVAFVAFTDIWNQGGLKYHAAKDHVADAGREAVAAGVKAGRATGADAVVVSYHGGEEYVSAPLQRAIDLHHAAIDAGADAVIGHHPHVAQGVEIYRDKPIFYSLGNYVMRTHRDHASTEIGFLAKVAFTRGEAPEAWICPFRIGGVIPKPIPLIEDSRADLYERVFRQRLRVVQGSIVGPATVGPTGEDGCAKVAGAGTPQVPPR